MTDVKTLMEMGFAKEKVEYALKMTNNKGVEPAMEWLLAHADAEIPKEIIKNDVDTVSMTPTADVANNADISPTEDSPTASTMQLDSSAKSLKCDKCGKLCKDPTDAEFHALKTGHLGFSESTEEKKPLTEEEKKEQMALLEQRLKQKRIEREEREKTEALEREKNRIKSGKDMTEARKRMEEMEMKKILEQRKREKDEEKAARERVRAQIEADKVKRKAREQGATYLEAQSLVSSSTTQIKSTDAASSSIKSPPKEYSETRIQIRLQDGSTLLETFNVKEQLSAVRVFIQMKTGTDTPFALMTSFPRKIFTDDDYEKPLEVLGLVPSAVIIMTKAIA